MKKIKNIDEPLPVLPLRATAVFPNTVTSLLIGRKRTIEAIEYSSMGNRTLFLVTQKDPATEEPTSSDLFRVGTVGRILQIIRMPDNTLKVLIESVNRARVLRYNTHKNFTTALVESYKFSEKKDKSRIQALSRKVGELYKKYLSISNIPEELIGHINLDDPSRLCDIVSAQIGIDFKTKQYLLESKNLVEHSERLIQVLAREVNILELKVEIDSRVQDMMDNSQREFILRQQLEAIRNELGDEFVSSENELRELEQKIDEGNYPENVKNTLHKELKKLFRIPSTSPEAGVIRNYVDLLLELPWNEVSEDQQDVLVAEKILDEDHHGLEKIKKRIVEHIALMILSKVPRGPILCLVGPPGVGKTSVARSVARALNREFVRASLGGLHDEAEIRGHRKTYIGAMPGKIIQGIKKAGSKNPLFLLDEIDKIGSDYRGDPAAALMEVLDPDQNFSFTDNYVELPFDLSNVMFITTANTIDGIPFPLMDRMEILQISGYTEPEKTIIGRDYIMPKILEKSGLSKYKINIADEALKKIIIEYTRESGVRELERKLNQIVRKIALEITKSKTRKRVFNVSSAKIEEYLGVPYYLDSPIQKKLLPGESIGLAWTPYGGNILRVEVLLYPGKGKSHFTGSLGDVMKESIEASLSLVRTRSKEIGFDPTILSKNDIHVHFPEGAIPKDGPSAGIAIFTALASALSMKSLPNDLAMTGEITLTGRILPIGGLSEKLLAAKRFGIKRVVIPKLNENKLVEIKEDIIKGIEIIPISHIDEVLKIALPQGKTTKTDKKKVSMGKSAYITGQTVS